MQLESPDPAGTDPAMHPPAAAMQQSPESLGVVGNDAATTQEDLGFPENAGKDTGKHLPPWSSRVVYQFSRPVFRRCGRHLRAEKSICNGEYKGFRITKIGADERRSYPAIVNKPMAPHTGVYRWTWVVRRSPTGVVMPGICTEAADPEQHSLRFTPHGAAYEPWTDLFYDFHHNPSHLHHLQNDPDYNGWKFRQGDEIAFVLDTNFRVLDVYHSYYGLRCRTPVPELQYNTLYAYCGLEKPGDVVEYIEIDNEQVHPYFEHSHHEWPLARGRPPR